MNSKNNREDREQKKGKTKIQKGCENSSSYSDSRSLGDVTQSCTKAWNDQIGISRKVSQRRDIPRSSASEQIPGGTISQLIEIAEDQLAMLENSAKDTKKYISELKELLEAIEENQDRL